MKKINLVPNAITAFGLSCGLFVIFRSAMIGLGEMTPEILTQLSGILLIAALADLLDGAVARAIKAESEFGGFFDSMADGITFGVAPAIMVIKSVTLPPGTELSYLFVMAAMVFCVCGILRLVRYNVKDVPAGKLLPPTEKVTFTGLPIPASAALLISLNLFLMTKALFLIETQAYLTVFALLLLGYLMVSRLKFPSFKGLRFKVHSYRVVVLTAIAAVFLFYGLFHQFALSFLILAWGYLAVSLTLSFIRLLAGRKSKTLIEFEPEDDE
ncbi:MAG: CDP-alcohol phosphatidyltransferase family protein [Chlamydiia bacterium]|nr:CDP-alcohol phosphatidyltransferase family protein [Chlamydiia bacterium]